MCACDEGYECARHRAERERHDYEEQRELEPMPLADRAASGLTPIEALTLAFWAQRW